MRIRSGQSEVAFACSEGNRWVLIVEDSSKSVSVANQEGGCLKANLDNPDNTTLCRHSQNRGGNSSKVNSGVRRVSEDWE